MNTSTATNPEEENQLLKAALKYREMGLSVIPIKGKAYGEDANDAKHPLVPWKEFQRRLASVNEIKGWWSRWDRAAVGIVTGPISNLLALDSDGEEGEESLEWCEIPSTWTSITPRRGHHRYYRWSQRLAGVKSTVVGLLNKVDVRGEGGYVVAPPSMGFNNVPYRWLEGFSPENGLPADPPEWLLNGLEYRNTPENIKGGDSWDIGNPKGWVAEALANFQEGNRHSTVVKIAGKLLHDGWSRDEAYMLLEPHVEAGQTEEHNYSFDDLDHDITDVYSRYPKKGSSPLLSFKGGETEAESLPVITLSELLSADHAQGLNWRINNLLLDEAVGILGSFQGYGKSWMLLDLAIECSRGGLWLNKFQTSACPVLYIDEESSPALLQNRLRKLLKAKNTFQAAEGIYFAIGQGVSFDDPEIVPKLAKLIEETKPGLIIIDALVRVHRANENSSTEMARVFKVVKDLVREYKCSFMFADHHNKSFFGMPLEQRLRGTTEKGAFVDTLLSLKRKGDAVLIVEHSKSRAAQPVPSFLISITDPTSDSTVVQYIGEEDPQEKSDRLGSAMFSLAILMANGEWHSRKDLIDGGRKGGISAKSIDEALKYLESSGDIEREDRQPEGPGGKAAYYRELPKEGTPESDSVSNT